MSEGLQPQQNIPPETNSSLSNQNLQDGLVAPPFAPPTSPPLPNPQTPVATTQLTPPPAPLATPEVKPEKKKFSLPKIKLFSSGNPFSNGLRQKKVRNIVFISTGAILVLAVASFYILRLTRATIIITDSDTSIVVSANNKKLEPKKVDQGQSYTVRPGSYRLKIDKTNYLPFILDLQLGRGETQVVRPAYTFVPSNVEASSNTVDFVRSDEKQEIIHYLGDNKKALYRMEVAKQKHTPLTDKPLLGVTDVQWSTYPDVALVTQTDGIYLREIPRYDFQNQTLYKIGGREIISPKWDPLEPERIAFAYFPPSGEKSLIFSDKRAEVKDRKADLSDLTYPTLIWSSNDRYIMLIDHPKDLAKNNIWIYSTANGDLKQITTEGNILNASFSPDNQTILIEKGVSSPGNLSLVRTDGTSLKDLGINTKLKTIAWKNTTSFFFPDKSNNKMILYDFGAEAGKEQEEIPFSFQNTLTIEGMDYFGTSNLLVFYTNNNIYTLLLNK